MTTPERTEGRKSGQTKSDIAYESIKEKILEGDLPPHADIREEALQHELALSRTPIREACQRLCKEGFLQIYPSKGMFVTDVTAELIRDIYQMRLLNEPFIVREACRFNEQMGWFRDIRQRIAAPPSGLGERELRRYFIDLDRDLHDYLLRGCRNRFLLTAMSMVLDHNHRIRIKVSRPYDPEDRSVGEHLDIIDAVLARDEGRAEEAARRHIEASRQITFKYFL
ncbi:MAG: GntR family transcriptional regulator [Tropicimonas sp.]|uniref:GntR family transcriptional regulator n=1 Tax=Tropicimonas sp. TaxID=2067044 RepID=UPI003A83D35E